MKRCLLILLGLSAPAHANAPEAPFDFAYTYPPQARSIPALRRHFDGEAARERAALERDVRDAQREAKRSGFPFRPYTLSRAWSVVADTPRFLSLSLDGYDYAGGAHGTPFSRSLLWDKAQRARRTAASVFVSLPALQRALEPALCRAINAERDKRGASGGGIWDRCPRLEDATLFLGSASRQRIDRIGVRFDPYAIGSYAEGPYEVTLPVTPAVLAAVRPADRAAFGPGR